MVDYDAHKDQTVDRDEYTQIIIDSDSRLKVIIAGPGTGKSFTFGKLLETKGGKNLALTFINNLASDLQNELGDLAESHTFHGYCKKLLHRISISGIDRSFNYFPDLPFLVASDAQYLGAQLEELEETLNTLNQKQKIDFFEEAFHNLINDQRLNFFIERANYYNSVSHNDAVFRVLKYFQSNESRLPTYNQIVVDEYQDFNPLEVAFIDELAKVSPVLIAGDDDQAIYDFKHASPEHIRYRAMHPDFTKFELPYCSRCTDVIVEAVHDIAKKAHSINRLQNRIEKRYVCFLPDKEADNRKYPKIINVICSTQTKKAPYISKFIEKEIYEIPQEEIDHAREENYPCVLIAGPSFYNSQIHDYLKQRYTNIDFKEKGNDEIDIVDGYKLLLKDRESNLGWRIILECSDYTDISKLIHETQIQHKNLIELIDESFKDEHLSILSILKKLKSGDEVSGYEQKKVIDALGHGIKEVREILGNNSNADHENLEQKNDTSISIKITTLNGSKGLSAKYVFILGLNNTKSVLLKEPGKKRATKRTVRGFPIDSNNPTDNEICQFIVGITRTRNRCYLISNSRFGSVGGIQKSVFIDWIDPTRIDTINVNKEFFKNG